jgi:hypothetical protein
MNFLVCFFAFTMRAAYPRRVCLTPRFLLATAGGIGGIRSVRFEMSVHVESSMPTTYLLARGSPPSRRLPSS